DFLNFESVLRSAIATASERARLNAQQKQQFKDTYGDFGETIQSTELASVPVIQETVAAEFSIDPRTVTQKQITDFVIEAAQSALHSHENVKKVELVADTGIERQLFVSSLGSSIDQTWCFTGGTVFVVAVDEHENKPADLYHHTGNQLGFEAILEGKNTHGENLVEFANQIASEAVLLSKAPAAPQVDTPTTVVLDPDLVALFAHEIIGHPSELDRAMKMETGYAGRSWFMNNLEDTMVGKQVGSTLLNAFSDPTLKGAYGYYKYDDEGTPAKRVYHIKDGLYHDFMNSRQTAAIMDASPNGHYKANDPSVVPLIRMSVSAIEAGDQDPKQIISEVDNGYYCVGHRIPSISESRENFQIAPRLIYEIKNGELGQVYRDGRVTADSRDFFMSIDALGNDFKIYALPNCGKGQPMQTKRVGNGGPTARAKAMIARGE
ncbi:TldD/PmbA family protein, partial [candidate division WWE3 bacterium]|nr:TldD/PmbA family protein [candidate division WWE3 bacterium]